MSDIIKQDTVKIVSHVQVKVNRLIFACDKYICTGKYKVNGQNDIAPMRPRTLLKNGNIIATTDDIIT